MYIWNMYMYMYMFITCTKDIIQYNTQSTFNTMP